MTLCRAQEIECVKIAGREPFRIKPPRLALKKNCTEKCPTPHRSKKPEGLFALRKTMRPFFRLCEPRNLFLGIWFRAKMMYTSISNK